MSPRLGPGSTPAIVDGWLETAVHEPSPNADERPPGTAIELVVIHNISLPPGSYGGGHIAGLFTNRLDANADPYFAEIADVRVSAHLLIERSGRIVQFVPFDRRAWHAGASLFEGRTRCNDFSIGIELEGSDFDRFADAQYQSLNAVLAVLAACYPLRAVCGHSDIAPDRKTDPGPFFEWTRVVAPPGISLPFQRA